MLNRLIGLFRRRQAPHPPVDEADVIWCYRHLLGREPENAIVVQEKCRAESFRALVRDFLVSEEFRQNRLANRIALNRESVAECYRRVLGREPESEAVIREKLAYPSTEAVLMDMLNSPEFRTRSEVLNAWPVLAFLIVHGRMPGPKETLDAYPVDRIVRAIRQYFERSSLVPNPNTQSSSGKDDLLIVQTCDHERYVPILQATSRTALAYVRRWHCNYEVFYGIKRGVFPWHATFNRIYKLDELMRSGFKGWVLYLDADAYFVDFDFDVAAWLSDKQEYALIAARISDTEPFYWNVNIGVFFLNLGHAQGRELVSRWRNYYECRYEDADYRDAKHWDMLTNDQTAFHSILMNPDYEPYILTSGVRDLFNADSARVIRQILRSDPTSNDDGNFDARLQRIENAVANVLERERSALDGSGARD